MRIRKIWNSKYNAASNNVGLKSRSAMVIEIFNEVSFVNGDLELKARPSWAASELKRVHFPIVSYNTVEVNKATIPVTA
jgi:hypothetical protein